MALVRDEADVEIVGLLFLLLILPSLFLLSQIVVYSCFIITTTTISTSTSKSGNGSSSGSSSSRIRSK